MFYIIYKHTAEGLQRKSHRHPSQPVWGIWRMQKLHNNIFAEVFKAAAAA